MSERSEEILKSVRVSLVSLPSRNNGLEVEPGEARLISNVVLLAQDADTLSTDVIYMIQSVPKQGVLQLKVVAEPRN